MRGWLAAALSVLLAVPAQAEDRRAQSLHDFLAASFGEARAEWPDATYVAAFADLNGDGRDEALVSPYAGFFCGSGGCALYIYTPDGATWRQLAELTIVNAPVRLLASRSRGWRDLAFQVRGGGVDLPREARIRFDGQTYAPNPSLEPRTRAGAPGRVLIDDATPGRRLFD